MRTIHKFQLEINAEAQILELPENNRMLHVEYVMPRRAINVWYEVTADMTAERLPHKFRIFATGDGIPDHGEYVGSAIDQYLPESYHIYELKD